MPRGLRVTPNRVPLSRQKYGAGVTSWQSWSQGEQIAESGLDISFGALLQYVAHVGQCSILCKAHIRRKPGLP